MSKASIEAGRGHVSLSTDDSRLVQGLNSARQHLQSFGRNIAVIGASSLGAGAAIGAAMTPAIAIFATYEQALADLRAAANPTADQFARLRAQIESVARATGESLPEVTQAYSELLKAGISLEAVLGGVGQTAVQFARVSGMQMAETAVILVDALNVFGREGLTASQAVNIMNQAADASTISLREVSGAFASGGATMALFNQSMRTTATAIAILGNSGIKAEDAGTVLKTLMLRIATGSESAGAALTELGVNVRGANGQILPMIDLIDRLGNALNSRSLADRDRLMSDLAGDRGIRGLAVLLREGTAGWQRIQEQMGTALTVEQKFTIMTETLLGSLKKLWVNIQLIAVAIGEALEPAFRFAGAALIPVLHLIGIMIQQNQEIVQWVAGSAAAFVALGAALIGVGIALSIAGYAAGVLATLLSTLWSLTVFAASGFGILKVISAAWGLVSAAASAIATAGIGTYNAAMAIAHFLTWGLKAAVIALGAAVLIVFGGIQAAILGSVIYLGYLLASEAVRAFIRDWQMAGVLIERIRNAIVYLFNNFVLVTTFARSAWGKFTEAVGVEFAKLVQRLGYVWKLFGDTFGVMDFLSYALNYWREVFGQIFNVVSGFFGRMYDAASSFIGRITEVASITADNFATMMSGLVGTATQTWGGILDAFKTGDMETVWEIIKTAVMLAWAQIVAFIEPTWSLWTDTAIDTWNQVGDTLRSVFVDSWTAIRVLFMEGWTFLKAGFWDVAAELAESLFQNDNAAAFRRTAESTRALGRAEVGRVQAQNEREREERDQAAMDRDAELALTRIARDDAVAEGNAAEIERLQGELDALTNGAWQERMMQEYLAENFGDLAGAAAQQLTPGGEAAAAREKLSSMGSFSAQASFGFLGATSRQTGPMERLVDIQRDALTAHNRASQELLEAQRTAHQLLRAIERAAGAVFA